MSNKSRRRIKLAAGAILAGAAIPIAAAGTAWADDDSATAAGPVAAAGTGPAASTTPDTTPDMTQGAAELHREGLTRAEAQAVVAAEKGGTAVEVSHDGTLVVNDNNSAGDQATASTVAGSNHDVAAAIGAGSSATDSAGDVHDRAFAGSAGSTAEVDYAGHSSATATGGATADINTSATAQEAGASALTAGVGGPTGTGDMHDTATATDTNNGGSVADVELSTNSKAIASATSAYGSDAEVSTSTHSEASATGYGGESGNDAAAIGSSDSKALASDTSGGGSSAEVLNAFDGSKSIATNDDNSYVENASHSTATGDDGTTFHFAGVNGINDVSVTNVEVGAPFGATP